MDTEVVTDIIVLGIFWQALGLTVWFGWHWWMERRWTIALLAGTYLVIALQFGRVSVGYVLGCPGWGYGSWPSLISSTGIFLLLAVVCALALVGKLTK